MLTGISLFSQRQLGTDTIYMNVTVAQAKTMVDTNGLSSDFVVLDVRTQGEYVNGHIVNAINIDYYNATFSSQLDALDHNKMYLMHCQSGGRSTPTFALMQSKHFREVYHMNSGFGAWLGAGYPYVTGYTSVNDISNKEKIRVFINLTTEIIYVQSASEKTGDIFITDMQGKQVINGEVKMGMNQFSISGLPTGVYIVKIQSQELRFTKKIFVE